MTDEGSRNEPGSWKKFFRYMTASEDRPSKESRAWTVFRAVRWMAAVAVVVFAARATQHDVCQTTGTIRTGLGVFSNLPKTAMSRRCAPPGLTDLVGYFAIIAVLLLPDARSIAIGGLQFERLSSQVEKVAQDVGAVRQVFNIGVSFLDDLKTNFKSQKATLDPLRGFLPDDPGTSEQLTAIDDVAQALDDAPLGALLGIVIAMEGLIQKGRQGAAEELARRAAEQDTAEEAAAGGEADEVIREIRGADT